MSSRFVAFSPLTPITAAWLNQVDDLFFTTGSGGSYAIGHLQPGAAAVARALGAKVAEVYSVFDFMTAAEVAAVKAYTFTTNVTAAIQAALDAAWAAKADLFAPAGGYLTSGNTLPGNVLVVDERDQALRLFGQGYGNPFSLLNGGGTVFKSVTNAPILTDIAGGVAQNQGTFEVCYIRFDGSSTTPVVKFNSMYGTGGFHNNVIYQRSTGGGFQLLYGATASVHSNYVMNKDFVTFGLGAARVGIGFDFPLNYDAGLITFSKNTSRGWLTGYSLGGGAGTVYSAKITDCEVSLCYNGVLLASNVQGTVICDNYFEGGDGGIGIQNLGNYNTIRKNLIFPGFATLIQDNLTTNIGSVLEANTVSIGTVVNGIGVDVQSSSAFGGNGKSVIGNTILYTAGTAGVNGLKMSGTDPRITAIGNIYSPRAAWTGAGTLKVNDLSTNGIYGFSMKERGDVEAPYVSKGAITYATGPTLTEANVAASVLTFPDMMNFYVVTATVATPVNTLVAGVTSGRRILLRTTNANMTISDSAFIQTAGGVAFSGPGMIEFWVERSGANSFAYELTRTLF